MVRGLSLVICLLGVNAINAADWPTAAYDAARSGRTADSVAPPYRVRWAKAWQYENIATVAQLIVARQRGFIGTLGRDGSLAGKVHCVDIQDGRDLWTFEALSGGIAHTLTWSPHAGGTVYAASTAGEVVALAAATGELRWKFETPLGGFVVNPCVVDGTVLLGSRRGVFYALNESDGSVRWQRDAKYPICHTAAAADGIVYFLDEGMHPHALQVTDGKPAEHWLPRQLPGGSARFYWPVIAKEHVLMTVAPPHQYNWAVTDAVLFREPGVTSRKEGDRYAVGTPEQEAKEQQNVIEFLRQHSSNQVMHCLARSNGRPSCVPGVLYTGGSGSECTPPVLDKAGRPIVEYRSWYSLWDSDSWVNPYSALGTLDPATGVVTQLRPTLEGKRVPWGHVWIIADESSAFTMAGDRLMVAHQGNFGGLDLTTSRTFAGVGKRDTWGGYPALSWNRQEWHGGPRGALTVVDDSVYYVVGGRVIACDGDAKADGNVVETVVVPSQNKSIVFSFPEEARLPTLAEIEKVFEDFYSRKLEIDANQSRPLRDALQKHVDDALRTERHGPYFEWRGIAPTTASQYTNAQLIYALATAGPYLDARHRERVASIADGAIQSDGLATNVRQRTDEPRNYHRLNVEDARKVVAPLLPAARQDFLSLYACLKVSHYGPEDNVSPLIGGIRPRLDKRVDPGWLDSVPDERPEDQMIRLSAASKELTHLAGRIRVALLLQEVETLGTCTKLFEDQLRPYLLEYCRIGRRCAKEMDAVPGDEGHPSAGGQFRNLGGPYVGRMHMAAIVYWTDLCPELGRILREYAPEETAAIKAWMLRNAQGFYLARWDTPVQEGEVPCPLYLTTQNYFHFFSSVADADFTTHKLLVDMPACHADVYYIERLVHAIEASGKK